MSTPEAALRDMARTYPANHPQAVMCRRAADELDLRADRIDQLNECIRQLRKCLGEDL